MTAARTTELRRSRLGAVAMVVALVRPLLGMPHYVGLDVPSPLGGVEVASSQIARSDGGSGYTVWASLPAGAEVAALHVMGGGSYLAALRSATTIGGTTYESRDVLLASGAPPASPWFDGGDHGLPEDAAIDAIVLLPGGTLVMSFDAPTTLSGATYMPSDLVAWQGGSSYGLAWSAAAWGVPMDANVVGAARSETGGFVLSFDVPVTLDGTTYLPGDLVSAGPGTGQFQLAYRDPAWPAGARVADFGFPPAPGAVPDGSGAPPSVPLTASKLGADVLLSWGAACQPSGTTYAIYEGTIGSWYDHSAKACGVAATSQTVGPVPGNTYYLVVPINEVEGSYGTSSSGQERPAGTTACAPRVLGSCP